MIKRSATNMQPEEMHLKRNLKLHFERNVVENVAEFTTKMQLKMQPNSLQCSAAFHTMDSLIAGSWCGNEMNRFWPQFPK